MPSSIAHSLTSQGVEAAGVTREAPPDPVSRSPPADLLAHFAEARLALQTHRSTLAAHRGVVGAGLAYRVRGGAWIPEPCVTVYVRRKRTPEELRRSRCDPVPPTLVLPGGGVSRVDVQEAGSLRRRLSCGARVGWRGLGRGQGWGTLGLVARDRATGRPVAVTAMHVTGRTAYPPGDPMHFHAAEAPGAPPVRLGSLLLGVMRDVDAAKISIDDPARVEAFLPGVGAFRGARGPDEADLGCGVQLYGAGSGFQSGYVTAVGVDYPGDQLRGAFHVRMRCGRGDSGAACCDLGGVVLGLFIGSRTADPFTQVFCPIPAVLTALDCEL